MLWIKGLQKLRTWCTRNNNYSILWSYYYNCVIIMSHKSFRVNLHSTICMNVKELLARSRCHIWTLSDSNEIWTHNHLVPKRTINHLANLGKLASLAKWLSVGLWTKWLWVRIPLLPLVAVSKNNLSGRRVTLSWRRPLSYRNQSINLRSKINELVSIW